ncbi:MAG: TrmH family RNA methyltransferase [Polyangiaceae bacterium]|nr:TrmH family RNA methyltransferase [Polyangiaceae bacterium]
MALYPPIEESADEVRAVLAPLRNSISVALFAHENAFSVGGIIRVAHSFLVREIIIIGTEPYYPKASMGMHRFESIRVFRDDEQFFEQVRGRLVWAVEKERATRSVFDPRPFPTDVVFLFGSERGGLPSAVLDRSDEVIGLPMYGVNNSFPVSVAVGMVLSEWGRRHYGAGLAV